MGEKGRKVGLRIAGIGAGTLVLGSAWTGAALADDPITADPGASSPVATATSAPSGTGPVDTVTGAGAAASAASAGRDNYCRYFPSQAAAQVYFTSIGGSATNNAHDLDANHNGIACEDYNYGTAGTPGVGATSSATGVAPTGVAPTGDNYCRYFPSQAAAQVYFTSIGGSATNNAHDLDANHNGIACEDYNYGTAGTPGVGATSSASGVAPIGDRDCRDFPSQAAAQVYFTSIGGSATNNANDLDANHNGIACEDYNYGTAGTASSSTTGTPGSTAGPAQVSVVPRGGVNTGDGSFTR